MTDENANCRTSCSGDVRRVLTLEISGERSESAGLTCWAALHGNDRLRTNDNNVIPIRPTVGMSRMEQLRAFVAWEKDNYPDRTHIAAWALKEIERLRALVPPNNQVERP